MSGMAIAVLTLDLIDTLVALYSAWPSVKGEVDLLRADVQRMVDEGRDPTEDELRALAIENRLLTIRLKAAAERAQGV